MIAFGSKLLSCHQSTWEANPSPPEPLRFAQATDAQRPPGVWTADWFDLTACFVEDLDYFGMPQMRRVQKRSKASVSSLTFVNASVAENLDHFKIALFRCYSKWSCARMRSQFLLRAIRTQKSYHSNMTLLRSREKRCFSI